jgi:hypothetical protein
MSESNGTPQRPGIRKWLWLTAGLTPLSLLALLAIYWVHDHVPRRLYWQAGLAFLVVLEPAYFAAFASSLVATPMLTLVVLRARRRGVKLEWVPRALLLSVTVLVGLLLSEVAAALRQASIQRTAVLPAGAPKPSREAPDPLRVVRHQEIALPTAFRDAPGDDPVNLVVVGESSAEGVPYHFWISVGTILAWQLEQAIPAHRFRLEVVATSGVTLESQHRKLAELTQRPDALIIYCGHNEFSARFPWSREVDHYLDQRPPRAWENFVGRIEGTSPLCGMIREAADKCRIAVPPPPEASRALVDVPAYTRAEYAALLADFERRLELLVSYAERVEALPIVIVPAANDSDFEPNRSLLPPNTPYAERVAFARDFEEARRLEGVDAGNALARYRVLVARQPGFAESHFRLARLLEKGGRWDEAYRHDIIARDQDGLPMRCPTPFQDACRAVASRHDCILVDSQAYFHKIAPHGLLDDHLFHDLLHPSLRGQIALAQAVLYGLHARRAFGWPRNSSAPILDPAQCAAHFKIGRYEWQRLCLWGIMVYDKIAPLHYDPSRRRAKQDAFGKAHDKIVAGRAPEEVGLPNVGVPLPVPLVPEAAIQTRPASKGN